MTVSDNRSFAKLALRKTMEQVEVLEIDFTWLSDTGGGKVTGRTEIIRLSYDKFKEYVRESDVDKDAVLRGKRQAKD